MWKKGIYLGMFVIILGLIFSNVMWYGVTIDYKTFREDRHEKILLLYNNDTKKYYDFEHYNNGDIILIRDKVKDFNYNDDTKTTLFQLESNNGFVEIKGKYTNTFSKGSEIFVKVKIISFSYATIENQTIMMEDYGIVEIYPGWLANLPFYIISIVGAILVIWYYFKGEEKDQEKIKGASSLGGWAVFTFAITIIGSIPLFLFGQEIFGIGTLGLSSLCVIGMVLIHLRQYKVGIIVCILGTVWIPIISVISSFILARMGKIGTKQYYKTDERKIKANVIPDKPLKQGSMSIFEKPLPIEENKQSMRPHPQYYQQTPNQIQQPQIFQCPNCNSLIQIETTQRPLFVKCQNCGMEGEIK